MDSFTKRNLVQSMKLLTQRVQVRSFSGLLPSEAGILFPYEGEEDSFLQVEEGVWIDRSTHHFRIWEGDWSWDSRESQRTYVREDKVPDVAKRLRREGFREEADILLEAYFEYIIPPPGS